MTTRTELLIVGSGGNGISAAVVLDRSGHSDLLIISKHEDFGGAWFQNTYPGCEVDCVSDLYQFSYAQNPEWSARFVRQPELMAYLQSVARSNGLYERTRFGTEMLGAHWDSESAFWSVETTTGTIEANHLVLATGFLEEAVIPTIPGLDAFDGPVFHSSRWQKGYTGEGDRVAVLGSGSSAIQIVPELQKHAEAVVQFQRTPTWILPKNNRRYLEDELRHRSASAAFVAEQRLLAFEEEEQMWEETFLSMNGAAYEQLSTEFMHREIKDPHLRKMVTPTHRIGCKRPIVSDDYYASLTEPNVKLVAEGVTAIDGRSVVSASGARFEVDAIVLATGFFFGGHILHKVHRRDGLTVGEYQGGHPRAYKSISVAGCPNLYLVGGPAPNGQIWNGLYPGEAVGTYVAAALEHLQRSGSSALEVTEEFELAWKQTTDALLDQAPVVAGGCTNYSQDELGHNKAAWPGTLRSMTRELAVFDDSAYVPVMARAS